jgi:hypothetical protein
MDGWMDGQDCLATQLLSLCRVHPPAISELTGGIDADYRMTRWGVVRRYGTGVPILEERLLGIGIYVRIPVWQVRLGVLGQAEYLLVWFIPPRFACYDVVVV